MDVYRHDSSIPLSRERGCLHGRTRLDGACESKLEKLNRAHRMESNETLMPGSLLTLRYKRQHTEVVLKVITSEKVCGPFESSF